MSSVTFPALHIGHDLRCAPTSFLQNLDVVTPSVVGGAVVIGATVGGIYFGPAGAIAGVAICGAVAAVALAVIISSKQKEISQERQFLASLENEPSLSGEARRSTGKIKEFVLRAHFTLAQSFELHELHRHINQVSAEMAVVSPSLRNKWLAFLRRKEGTPVYYPDGGEHLIRTDIAKRITLGEPISYKIERLDPKSTEFERQAEEILRLDRECYTRDVSYTPETLKKQMRDSNSYCFLAKDDKTGKLLGLLWCKFEYTQELYLHICSVGRSASAARLGIAESLFQEFNELQRRMGSKAFLEVRESNEVAIRLYQKWGFIKTGVLEGYYAYPKENAYVMQRSGLAATQAA